MWGHFDPKFLKSREAALTVRERTKNRVQYVPGQEQTPNGACVYIGLSTADVDIA
jgi:hypothetical protein